jgi:hypothetical protein
MELMFCKYVNVRPSAILGQAEEVNEFDTFSPLGLAPEHQPPVATRRMRCGDRQHGKPRLHEFGRQHVH